MKNQPDGLATEPQHLKPDLLVSPWVTLHTVYPQGAPDWIAVSAQAIFVPSEQRYVIVDVEMQRPVERGGLTAVDIRDVPIMTILAPALMQSVGIETAGGVEEIDLAAPRLPRALAREDVQLMAARKYSLARAVGLPALQTVADYLAVSQSTATRMIANARRDGLVD